MSTSGAKRLSDPLKWEDNLRKRVCVYDCRFEQEDAEYKWLDISGFDFNDFVDALQQEFGVDQQEPFVLVTTDRTVLDFDKFKDLPDNSTLHLLQNEDQAPSVATKECIKFTPHYDTVVKSGMYEYYASQGQNPLPYTFAELIDNALSATAKNTGMRTIELRMLFDETIGKPAVIVLDNGCGMTSEQLKNWAVFRLSKFNRKNVKFASEQEEYVRPDPVPRSLNSDISYFGVGGKQAVFYVGHSVRMISKPAGSPNVHELILSEEEFKRKERNKEEVYNGIITNRMPGNSSHVKNDDERFLHALIAEESGKASFTAVVITDIWPDHVAFLKNDFEVWTRQLAHIYHYYIHGVNGNDLSSSSTNSDDRTKIEIQITLREKSPRCPRVINIREVEDDMQSLYINTAADTFEFMAEQDGGRVEGIIRYHPFLYYKETYPEDPSAVQGDDDEDDNECRARERRPIFECFWNGRLIPNTKVSEFHWCTWNKDSKLPEECYSRLSGVLFTDDRFQVSNNKLTFMDLEQRLKQKDTMFTRIVNGQKQRGVEKEFKQWLQSCHEKWDKQIQFLGFKGTITRTDVAKKKMQHPWGTFSSIEWDGKTYKAGQFVKSVKTQPIVYGKVVQFLLYGSHSGDVFATGGEVEVALEPQALYEKTKTILISKIDQIATVEAIKKHIDSDAVRLPDKLKVDWPEGNPWPQNAARPAGTPFGPIKIEILNKKEGSITVMPSGGHGPGRKLSIEQKLVRHGVKRDQEISSFVAQRCGQWGFWFKKIECLMDLGKYTMTLNTMISESNVTVFGGRPLPSYKLKFTIKEGDAERFVIGPVSSPLVVGVPFNIPLLIKDGYDHPTVPPPDLKPVLQCSGLDLSHEKVDISGTTLTIKGAKARGKQAKLYKLKVTLPGLKKESTQSIDIVLVPGKPHSLHVPRKDNPITAMNGDPVRFDVEVHDEAGNITANPKQIVRCEVQGHPPVTTMCSSTGAGHLAINPINVKLKKGEPQKLNVQFDMPNHKNVASVIRELEVLPSTRVASMELCSRDDGNLVLRNKEKIEWPAGGMLENLFYKLYDEAGRGVPITAEIASRIKVNWTAEVYTEDLIQGKLPDIQVPTQVQEERFYQVSYQDQSVSISFTIVPHPDEPAQLKATLAQNSVKLGETLDGNIILDLVDQYDNVTKTLTSTCVKHMSVEAEDLDKSAITFMWQESSGSVVVTGVRFQSGTPGSKELCFTYKSYMARVIVKVSPGVPAQLKLLDEPEKPLQVLNDHGISTPFLVQLCDEWGNPSPDQRVVVQLRCSSPTLKVKTSVISKPVNTEGKASFTVTGVNGPKGCYQLIFQGLFNNKCISSPSVNLTVIPDPNKAVSLSVEYDTDAKFPAGGKFPVFSVTVVSEEGRPMTCNPAAATMLLWKGGPAGGDKATVLRCSRPLENEKNDCFHFRDKEIPQEVGKYTIKFSLQVDKIKVLSSDQITVNVEANQPVKLGPDSQPPTPVVSYSESIAGQTLVENMTLRIMDSYGNPTGQNLDGKVNVSIKNLSGENKPLPLFEGKTNSCQFSLKGGKLLITRLAVMEKSPGEDGSSYTLVFKPEGFTLSTPLAPFELLFHFYNDVENQRKMSELTKKKDELTAAVTAYQNMFSAHNQLRQMLMSKHQDACEKERIHRTELSKKKVNVATTVSIPDVDRLLQGKSAEMDRILKMPRRVFSMNDPHRGQQDVLGMVGHLAFVQDDTAARVISWHIQGDMDCVITRTTEAAKGIYDRTNGSQQVMPLDTMFKVSADRPLPHIRNCRKLFEPPGNPVHARQLLMFTQDPESCNTVFKNLLGETILIDDLDSGNSYRKAVVQNNIPCPTILTRQGDRISSRGKFGGANNKAPPTVRFMFGAPYPQQYLTLREQIGVLCEYRSILEKKNKAEKEYNDHSEELNSPEMSKKQQDMKEKVKQLEEIKRQCESTPVRQLKRASDSVGEPSGITAKRTRQTPK
ncbi:structural maintenance of chromosomes flexible hinge domain-containing protein 1 isoform X2 [Acanthopagrus latus]|uniref:structural maintenance of chromosomes flexible hinge domain-containing protein 1 isoform X2 n=1 Tax=Acanthopagrus latus TaxID=8177 RepID=UPI00187CA2BF|nr:structural maintenance of chromosomes flexible hinge domain-containing protein 1 isoform X2 [Acanthopagrus latus]